VLGGVPAGRLVHECDREAALESTPEARPKRRGMDAKEPLKPGCTLEPGNQRERAKM
jgi:hypothetical protein